MQIMRKKPEASDSFSFSELALAGAITKRAFQHVADAERPSLLPVGSGIKVLKRIAVIGAFINSGVPLFLAARISRIILNEFNQVDGEAPSGLSHLVLSVRNDEILKKRSTDNDYWYHLALYRNPAVYDGHRGLSQPSDAIIHIADRRLISISTPNFPQPSVVGWIEQWERGSNARVKYITDVIGAPDPEKLEEWQPKIDNLDREARSVQVNAVGRLRINASLAIRNALDRVQGHRHGEKPVMPPG